MVDWAGGTVAVAGMFSVDGMLERETLLEGGWGLCLCFRLMDLGEGDWIDGFRRRKSD